jgi:thiol:disulfide interchange protein DsbA
MKWLHSLLLLGLCSFITPIFAASEPQEGIQYMRLSPPVSAPSTGKIEVIEFFSYACPHCAHFAPFIESWAKKQPASVHFTRIPVQFGRPEWGTLARLYYTLQNMKLIPEYQEKVFQALHEQHINLLAEDEMADWIQKQGINRKRFLEIYHSFTIQSEVQRGDDLASRYSVDSVPMVFVANQYVTSPSMAGGNEEAIGALTVMVNKANTK